MYFAIFYNFEKYSKYRGGDKPYRYLNVCAYKMRTRTRTHTRAEREREKKTKIRTNFEDFPNQT